MDSTYVVIDIGCLECGESSNIVGAYSNKARADSIATRLNKNLSFTTGQHAYEVFKLPELNTIGAYYT